MVPNLEKMDFPQISDCHWIYCEGCGKDFNARLLGRERDAKVYFTVIQVLNHNLLILSPCWRLFRRLVIFYLKCAAYKFTYLLTYLLVWQLLLVLLSAFVVISVQMLHKLLKHLLSI